MGRAGSDIRIPLVQPLDQIVRGSRFSRSGSFLDHFDRDFRAIGLGEPGLVFHSVGDSAVADLVSVAEFVEIEQFGRQRFTAGMSLAPVLIDMYFQLAGHSSVPLSPALDASRLCLL